MAELKSDWVTDGLVDFEYKKYILLDYLKKIREQFFSLKLYPFLSDLIFHYNNIKLIQQNKTIMYNHFPQKLKGIDFENLKLHYKKIIEDNELMNEIEQIMEYASPKIEEAVNEGKEIFDFSEDNIDISVVGLLPLYTKEGYVFVESEHKKPMNVYRYQITVFEQANENYKAVNFSFLESKAKSSFETYENIKMQVVKKHKELPNPATYLIECKTSLPYHSTLMPVAKRMFMKYVSTT